jgi:hypothetical protein
MSKAKNISPAQMIDSFLRRVGLGVAIVGVMYGVSALEAVLPPAEADYADTAQLVLSILVVLLLFPAFVKFMLARKRGVCKSAEDNSYMAQMFKQAAHHAFSATFITLIILEVVAKALKPGLPMHFFIDIALFISLSFFAAMFFKLTGADDGDDDWEDDAA